jgi:MFS family permease
VPAKLHRNIKLIYSLAFFHSFMIIAPVLVPFFVSKGLSLAEVFYLQAVYATTIVLLEAPSGYFADLFGRRRLLIIGASIHSLSYFFLNFAQSLEALLLFEIVLGVASSLLSGADLALLYDSQKAIGEDENSEHSKGIANLGFFRSSAEGIGALLGGLLAMWSFELLVLAQSAVAWVCIVVASLLIESPYKSADGDINRVRISYILRYMLAGDPMLRRIVIAIPLYNLTTFLAAWLIQPYWEEQGLSLGLFGLLWCLQSLTTATANKLGFALERKYGAISALICIGILPIAGHLGLAFLDSWQGISFGLLLFVCRGLNQVILVNALNRRVPSEFRATANSLTSFIFRFAFIVTGPLLGYVAEYLSITTAFLVLAGATLGLFAVVMLPLLKRVHSTKAQIAT